ncbi:MAG: AI-2E family transporter [Sphingomonadaceae bacterium]|nr:AI-2E family transporter [Sphingomonadaceae bacterium]
MVDENEVRVAGPPKSPSSSTLRTRHIWLTVVILCLALWVAQPFIGPIAWAAVLAIAEWPLFLRAAKRYPQRRGLLALGFTIATALFVVFPLSLVATSLAAESQNAIDWLQRAQQTGVPAPAWLSGIPLVGARITGWWQTHIGSAAAAQRLLGSANAGSVFVWARAIAGEVAKQSGLFLVTLIALVSLLARGDQIANQAHVISGRMFGPFGEDFLVRMTQAVRRTVAGTLLVSVAEGSMIGIGYAIARVPQPLLFAVATIVLALVPFGAWLAFGLAGLILIAQSHVLAGGLLIAFGVTVMTVGDNVVQPAVIGGAVELPFLLALVGAFGGLAEMGLVGLFIGPVIMVALLLIWREWTATKGLALKSALHKSGR